MVRPIYLLYIDPGTGSMLFTIAIGVVVAMSFIVQKIALKLKFLFTGGKTEKASAEKKSIVIFGESSRYYNVFKPLCDALEEGKVSCEYWAATKNDPLLQDKFEYIQTSFIGEGNRAYARLNMMRANICVATTPGLDVYQWKRSKDVDWYVHIFHSLDDGTLYRMFAMDYYDAILAPAPFVEPPTRKLEELRHLPTKEVCVVGLTYMDDLGHRLSQCKREMVQERTILLAPSWGKSGILSRYGEEILNALVKTGYRIVVRPHPQSMISEMDIINRLATKFPSNNKFIWNYDRDNFSALREADLMISDFSSVILDFTLVFDKPILYADTSFDTSPYDAAWLDEPAWTFKILPELGIQLCQEQFSNMKKVIDELLLNDKYAKARAKVRNEARCHSGKASERIAKYLIQKLDDLKQQSME